LYQHFEKPNEGIRIRIRRPLNGFEPKLSTGPNDRDHIDAEATTGIGNLWVSLLFPLFHSFWLLLVRPVQWPLRCQAQLAKQATDRDITESNIELLADQLPYPQGKIEFQLGRGKGGNLGVCAAEVF